MKIFLILILSLFSLFHPDMDQNKNTLANVDQVEGVLVFYHSKPVQEYNYIGTVKVGMTMTNKASECLRALVKKAKKDYSNADAIIVFDLDFQKADAIKFK